MTSRTFPVEFNQIFRDYRILDGEQSELQAKTARDNFQHFVSKYLTSALNYEKSLLLYHGVGTGKTSKAIFFLNAIHKIDASTNIFILLKASLHNNFLREFSKWSNSGGEVLKKRLKYVHLIHFNAGNASAALDEAKRKCDIEKKNIYLIDEVHLFISAVANNMSEGRGDSLRLYETITADRMLGNTTVLAMTATPVSNDYFELAILFNLLKARCFPTNREEFKQTFTVRVNGELKINPRTANMFQRRILGLVSYYSPGALPGVYARREEGIVKCRMSEKQSDNYREASLLKTMFQTAEQRASSFVIPNISSKINSRMRPTERAVVNSAKSSRQIYVAELLKFEAAIEQYFSKLNREDSKNGHTIESDILQFVHFNSIDAFMASPGKKSRLIKVLHEHSAKYVSSIFLLLRSRGPAMAFLRSIALEGMHMYRIYLRCFGFDHYKTARPGFGYAEITGEVDPKVRDASIQAESSPENALGKQVKVMLFSEASAEGISLQHIRQVHLVEETWNETSAEQIIGRAIRKHSHKCIPMADRVVEIYRFHAERNPRIVKIDPIDPARNTEIIETDTSKLKTVDAVMYERASNKASIIQGFYGLIQSAAVDCVLNSAENMRDQSYSCFQFPDSVAFTEARAASVLDLARDQKQSIGLNSGNMVKTRVYAIMDESESCKFWYNPVSGHVYDYDLKILRGEVAREHGHPVSHKAGVYRVSLLEIDE